MADNITKVPEQYDPKTFRNIVRDLVRRFSQVEASVGTYSVSNFTTTRTLDMVTADSDDIGNFLCTLVSDLQKAGKLGA